MFGILLVIHVLVTVLLIFVVLVQESEGGSSLFASGAGNGMFTARGTSDILSKSTWILATVFLCNCILMAHISSKEVKHANSILASSQLKKISTNKKQSNRATSNNKITNEKTNKPVNGKNNKLSSKSEKENSKVKSFEKGTNSSKKDNEINLEKKNG